MTVFVRVAMSALCVMLIFGLAYWMHEVFVLECARTGNTAPACELSVSKRGKTALTRLESGMLAGAEVKHRRVYDNDGSFVDHFYLALNTSRGAVLSSSGNSDTTVRDAAGRVNAFVKDASLQHLRVALDNRLTVYGIATLLSLMAVYVVHLLRH
jgi:hypothetical protein